MNTQCVNRTALVFCSPTMFSFLFPFFAWGIHVWSWSMCVYRSKIVWPLLFWCNLCIDEQMNCCFQLSLEDSNTDKRLGVHAHLIDKQSEDHKRNNSYHAIAHPANTSFQNVKWKRCCKGAVFYWLKMVPSFDHNDQFMDYLHFKYKV